MMPTKVPTIGTNNNDNNRSNITVVNRHPHANVTDSLCERNRVENETKQTLS